MPQPFLGDFMKLTHTLTAMGTAALHDRRGTRVADREPLARRARRQ